MTVKSLRQAGHKVRVTHLRHALIEGWTRGEYYREFVSDRTDILRNLDADFYPKGGLTVVEVSLKDGRTVQAEALFPPDQNYNRKLGVQSALSAASQLLNRPVLVDFELVPTFWVI